MKYTFQNRSEAPVTFIIEPWAEEFTVPSGSVLSIEISSSKFDLMETSTDGKYFVLWLWAGSSAVVSLDGEQQARPSLLIAVPR
jgi:hypothetical protein